MSIFLFYTILCAYIAKKKNRNYIAWGLLGYFFNLLPLLIIIFLPNNEPETINSI